MAIIATSGDFPRREAGPSRAGRIDACTKSTRKTDKMPSLPRQSDRRLHRIDAQNRQKPSSPHPITSRSGDLRVQAPVLGQQAKPGRRQQRDPIRDQPQDVVVIVRANRHFWRIIDRVRLTPPLETANFREVGLVHGMALENIFSE
jgi:hypothetical protein